MLSPRPMGWLSWFSRASLWTGKAGSRKLSAHSATSEFSLEVVGITKSFDQQRVLDQVSFSVPRGSIATLLGPSGCGKTTLLRIVAGLELPEAGDLLLSGRSVLGLPASQRAVNTVFQNYALFPHLSVFENVAFGLRARHFPDSEIKRRVRDYLELLELGDKGRRSTVQLSGGEKQRVALARALVNEPEVLLLDEPLSALDARLRRDLQVELRRLQRKLGTTFLLVTHDQDEAMTVSDQILVMNQGRIVQQGRPEETYEVPRTRFVAEFLGSANILTAQRREDFVETPVGLLRARVPDNWRSGLLSLRPEKILLSQSEPLCNGVKVVLREVVYRGDHIDVWVDPGPLQVRCPSTSKLDVGQSLWAQLPEEALNLLEGEPPDQDLPG